MADEGLSETEAEARRLEAQRKAEARALRNSKLLGRFEQYLQDHVDGTAVSPVPELALVIMATKAIEKDL